MRSLPHTLQLETPEGANHIDNYVLSAGTATAVAVPDGARTAVFSATGVFYARWGGGDAAVPAADVTDGSGSETSPTIRNVIGLTAFSLAAPAACVVAVAWYS